MSVVAANLLDNVVWHAIAGPQHALAERVGAAGRFHSEVSPFAAIRDPSSKATWNDLAQLVGPGRAAILFASTVDAPTGWVREHGIPCLQMVADKVPERDLTDDLIELGPDDVPDMLDLVAATQPGPFGRRTIDFGTYLGIRSSGRLVAMAGERFRCVGFTEVSAVCVAEDQRGRGLARRLVLAVVNGIRARNEEAILHVASDNAPAIALYLDLGFTVRREAEAVIVRNQGAL